MDDLNYENEGLAFNPSEAYEDINIDLLENELIDDLVSDIEPYWIPLFPEHSVYRFLSVDDFRSKNGEARDLIWYRPILLINGYQSNRSTWNSFAQQLWNLGFRSIFAFEPDDFSPDLQMMYEKFDVIIKTILDFIALFKSVILIGHSLGGIVARNYVKHIEKRNSSNVSLLITFAAPYDGVAKNLTPIKSLFKLVFDPEAVDLLSGRGTVFQLSKIYQKKELFITSVNVQGSLKRFGGTDGIIKPAPESDMINYVVNRNHFRIKKSLKVFNLLKDFLTNEAIIYKIQLISISLPTIQVLSKIMIYLEIEVDDEIFQRFPIMEDLELEDNEYIPSIPQIIFTGKSDNFNQTKEIKVKVFRKKVFSDEKLLEEVFIINLDNEEPVFAYQNIQNSLISLNFNVISYKSGKGLI